MNQPNFLVICLDQISAFSLGCNGNRIVQTPNIDKLASRGVNFTRAYCSNPVCMPNRASFITGLTPRQHGLLTNGSFLPQEVPTIGAALTEKGYRTHSVGKLHLQPVGPNLIDDGRQSWEHDSRWKSRELTALPSPYYGYQTAEWTGGHGFGISGHYMQWLEDNHPDAVPKWERRNAYYQNGAAFRLDIPPELHYNNWIADRTIDFLTDHRTTVNGSQPFFLFCSFPDPHFPFAATKPYSEMYDPADVDLPPTYGDRESLIPFLEQYRPYFKRNDAPAEDEMREIIAQTYGMITHIDDNVGRILDKFHELGLDQDTHVIFTADHGEYLGSHDLIRKGAYPFESLWRIPFIWHAPGGSSADCDQPTATVDFMPTVCELADIDPAYFMARGFGESEKLDTPGQSLLPALNNDPLPDRPVLLEYDEDLLAGPLIRQRGLVDGSLKLTQYYSSEECILVDVDQDPDEQQNLWNRPEYRDRQASMIVALSQRLIATERFDNPCVGLA